MNRIDSKKIRAQEELARRALADLVVTVKGEISGVSVVYPVLDTAKLSSTLEYLRERTGRNKDIDPFEMPDGNAWVQVSAALAGMNEYDFALLFILEYLDLCYKLQLDTGDRVHKGAAHFWAYNRYLANDLDELAFSHLVLAFVEDALTHRKPKTAPAWYFLTTKFRFAKDSLNPLIGYLKTNAKKNRMMWLFPEYALIRYYVDFKRPLPSHLQMPFNRLLLAEQCRLLSRKGRKRNGKMLEWLMVYLFKLIPDLAVEWRALTRAGEFDLIVSNHAPLHEPARWFGDYLLVECKDTDSKVDTKELEAFFAKLSVTKIMTGVIVSQKGLSGTNELKHARGLKNTLFAASSITVMDLSLKELCAIDSPADFVKLLTQRYEDVRFGRLRQTVSKKN